MLSTAWGIDAREDRARLLVRATGYTRAELFAYPERLLTTEQRAWFDAAVERRSAGEPLAYILGEVWFYGRRFVVDARVLVPRPETEHLIDDALERKPHARHCLDVGTGSGAIAVTLACELPITQVTAVDISRNALTLAAQNMSHHGVDTRIRLLQSDLLESHEPYGELAARYSKYDVVIANLPYIPSHALPRRPDPVGYEPVLALDGGYDGLDLYRRLFSQLPTHLASDALLLCEAAPPTIAGLLKLIRASFPLCESDIGYDYAGLERYVVAAIKTSPRSDHGIYQT